MDTPTAEAVFHDRDDAVRAVDLLLEAHVPARHIRLATEEGRAIRVRQSNDMARTALLGAAAGLATALLLLAVGATGIIALPVMQEIVASVGLLGAAARLGFLGMAAGLLAGALGGMRTSPRPVDEEHRLDRARRIVLRIRQGGKDAIAALKAAHPDELTVFSAR